MKRTQFVIAALFLLAACGGDSTGPKTPDVSGSWRYNVTNLSGNGLSCDIGGVTVTLSQTGTTFTGSFGSGTVNCGAAGSSNFTGGPIVSGVVSGNSVTFSFGTQDWTHTGTLSGNSLAGTVSVRLVPTGAPPVVLLGSFAMVRN